MHSLVFPTNSSSNDPLPAGVLKMASGNVTVITRSPKSNHHKCKKSEKNSKRKMSFKHDHDENAEATPSRKKSKLTGTARRNERERNRVKQVNMGFAKLRDHVPKRGRGRKMSKVDILHSAVDYIRQLQTIVDESDAASAVMDIAALSASLTEDGRLIAGEPAESCSSAPFSPGAVSTDGSTASSSSSSYEPVAPRGGGDIPQYSPDTPALFDLALWLQS